MICGIWVSQGHLLETGSGRWSVKVICWNLGQVFGSVKVIFWKLGQVVGAVKVILKTGSGRWFGHGHLLETWVRLLVSADGLSCRRKTGRGRSELSVSH